MELKDLKTGYIIETKSGTLLLVMKIEDEYGNLSNVAMSENAWINLSHYNNDFSRSEFLKPYNGESIEDGRSIVAVYKPKRNHYQYTLSELLDRKNLTMIWSFNEVKKMKLKEIEKELGYKIQIIS